MKLHRKLYTGLTACSLLAISACGGASGIKETLGIGSRSPDEFRVVSRPPLSVPPQFNLRPPSADAQSPIVVPADKQARSIITGNPVQAQGENDIGYDNSVETAVMPVESVSIDSAKNKKDTVSNKGGASSSPFLSKIGADKADPKVREELIEQKMQAQEKKEEGSWWSNLTSTTEKKDTLVNAEQESKRIKDNKAANKPITTGQTPEVKDKDRGLIGNILGW